MTVTSAVQRSAQRPRGRRVPWSSETGAGLAFVAPVVLVFTVVQIIPAINSFYLSFTDYSQLRPPTFVGLANYRALLSDQLFLKASVNTVVYTVATVVISTALALVIALMLDKRLRFLAFWRTLYYLPAVVSFVSVGVIWAYILNSEFGLLNHLLSLVGVSKQGFLSDPALAMPSVIGVGVWKALGYNIVIYLAALQGLPGYVHEAALVDGAKAWMRFRRITVPMLTPTTVLVILLTGIQSVQAFDQIVVLTNGGPANATTTVVHQIFRNAFSFLKMGYASAMAVPLFLTILVMALIVLRVGRRDFRL